MDSEVVFAYSTLITKAEISDDELCATRPGRVLSIGSRLVSVSKVMELVCHVLAAKGLTDTSTEIAG